MPALAPPLGRLVHFLHVKATLCEYFLLEAAGANARGLVGDPAALRFGSQLSIFTLVALHQDGLVCLPEAGRQFPVTTL